MEPLTALGAEVVAERVEPGHDELHGPEVDRQQQCPPPVVRCGTHAMASSPSLVLHRARHLSRTGCEGAARGRRRGLAYTRALLSRSALPTTETELKLIAAAAMMGLSSTPKKGYSTPAATGTPRLL